MSEYYQNQFPCEKLLPALDEREVESIVKECDYTHEANLIAEDTFGNSDNNVNTADATTFYIMGYNAAVERLNKVLKPINL